MARYIGPKTKIARKFKETIFGPDKAYSRKPVIKTTRRTGKISEYATQLREKQKAKFIYGVLERQFLKTFNEASRRPGITGAILLQLLEMRLDNVVYRLQIAPTRAAARQLVSHCHITVNDKVVNIPSYQLRPGDIVGVRERSKSLDVILTSLKGWSRKYEWFEWDATNLKGKVMHLPEREVIPETIQEQLIVELYSK
ncbi:MAG: 30S ribosomal protein S4 [Bacteroidales bacterium]|jgi:small subunit ribosomal protein S4|nr:30S ribosomal protein S4 [Bacteroidales bacterium]